MGSTTAGLGHPSLIYDLCIKASVMVEPSEEVVHPRLVLKPRHRRKVFKSLGLISDSSIPQAPHPSLPARETSNDITSQLQAMNLQMMQWLERMQLQLNQMQNSMYD